MDITYKLTYRQQMPVMKLSGRFDAEGAAFIKGQITTLVNETQPNLVVNMSDVSFIDSLGLTALVSGLKLCRRNHGTLKLVGLQTSVRLLFEITRLDHAFEIYDSEEEAFNSFERS
jgi:anti-sigma B factor antagonist